MKKLLFTIIACIFLIRCGFAQNLIRKVDINIESFRQQLSTARHENVLGIGNAKNSETVITLPLPDGTSARFKVIEYSVLPSGINSDAKTYLGEQVGNPAVVCRITATKDKMIATIQIGGQIIVIERDAASALISAYNVYSRLPETFECDADKVLQKNGRLKEITTTQDYTNGTILRTYRMAIIVTNEFYVARGNNDVAINNEVAAIINSLNGLYEKEIAVRFTLKSPTNPASANVFYRKTENINSYYQAINSLRTEMNTTYGTANYDIGHTLHTTGGGVAYYGVCNDSYKGGGWSGSTSPSSILLMAHEVGHQFTAPHTFNGNGNANCSIGNRNTATAFEPGSGTTIMSYAGTCIASQNIAGGQEPYFHTNSLDNMINYIQNGTGNTCGTPTSTGNAAPVANAGSNYTIPKNTPFTLKGSATDANGDVLNYTWEEYDVPVAADSGKLGHTGNAVLSTTAPLFRSRQSTSPVRNFPDMSFVVNNQNNPPDTEGEDLPNVGRTMVFRLTARDNRAGGGGVDMASVTITVNGNTGPLAVTSPNGAESWAANSSQTVSWSVANTNQLSENVKILLSIDGGYSYPFVLAASTPNDGSQLVAIPSNIPNTSQARIKVASTNSLTAEFFDISNANFTVTSNCPAIATFICSDDAVSGNSGSPVFNLGLIKTTGSLFSGKSKTFSFSGTTNNTMVVYSNESQTTCHTTWSQPSKLVTFKVSKSGNYDISAISGLSNSNAFTIFNASPYNCASFVGSNAYTPQPNYVNWSGGKTLMLNACNTYYALVYKFNDFTDFSFKLNGPGDIIEVLSEPGGLNYTYVAVNQTNQQIVSVSSSSDFTSLSGGVFKVYGLAYAIGFDTNTLLNKTISEAYALGSCILFSNNNKDLTVIGSPCPTHLALTNPTDNITTGNITKQASAASGKIAATNFVTGSGTKATYQAKAIELNAGFKAETGSIFRAETGGCN
jgi:hypothetical protein